LLNTSLLFSLTGFVETSGFTISDETLPVTLSSFMAIPNCTDNSIAINWTTQSESNLIGYHILRAETNSLATAIKVTSTIIPATNSQLTNNYSFSDNEIEGQITYYYWLESVQASNNEFFGPVTAKIEQSEDDNGIDEIVLGNDLYSNYPNPFNPSTTISYSIAEASNVTIDIFNIKGQKINRIFSEYVQEVHTKRNIVWNGDDAAGNQVTSGIYFARIKTTSFTKTTKMLLTK
jgi:hypothetical protein